MTSKQQSGLRTACVAGGFLSLSQLWTHINSSLEFRDRGMFTLLGCFASVAAFVFLFGATISLCESKEN